MSQRKYLATSIYLVVFFSILWSAWVLIDYLQKRPLYLEALAKNIYYVPLILTGTTAVLVFFLIQYKLLLPKWINGTVILGLGALIFSLFLTISKNAISDTLLGSFGVENLSNFKFLVELHWRLIAVLFVCLSSFGWADLIIRRWQIPISNKGLRYLAGVAAGLGILSMYLFLIAAVDQLTWYLIWPFLLGGVAVSYKEIGEFLKILFVRPVLPQKDFSWFGYVSFALLYISLYIGIAQSMTIFPKGFDALNVYANIPNLLANEGGLLYGFRPYAWSLIQSMGIVAFGSSELSLMLSSMGGVLVAFAAYHLSTYNLGFRPDQSLLAVCLMLTAPAFTVQIGHELKIDLPLLFVQLVTLSLALTYINKEENRRVLILIGFLLGFGLTIKATTILIVFGFLIMLWYRPNRVALTMAVFCFILSGLLVLSLDRFSGLDHLIGGRNITAVVFILVGAVLALNHALADRQYILNRIRNSLVILCICVACMSPWLIKNGAECTQLSVNCLLNGTQSGITLGIGEADKKYQEYKRQNQNQ